MGEPRPVRDEDAFDVAAVDAWLRAHADPAAVAAWGEGLPEVRQFAGGASNLTYLLRYPGADLVLRRPPGGTKARSAHDMGREFRIQSALAGAFPYVAPMVGHCDDESVIGSEFYVMGRLDGQIPGKDLSVDLAPDAARRLCTRTLDLLVELHSVDVTGVADLAALDKGPGYVARQVAGWSERYARAITPNVSELADVRAWLAEHQPDDVRRCLIHNDFRLDNVVYATGDATEPIGLLDWEMATVGDPLMDLGSALAYWVQADDDDGMQLARMQPTDVPGMLTRAEVVAYYAERAGLEVTPESWRFYEVFGLFRLAVIVQQIYYRFHHGQTTNPRFELFWMMTNLLGDRCRALIAADPARTGADA
ncbi:MAG: phosphotransferase family protein [Nocardioides sp.]|uniref:phosphotransferase family protein n=1 Tax=Nocardioides sp. TaxID=35761 RepID=UPI0039E340D1